jgi:hypothetical protein
VKKLSLLFDVLQDHDHDLYPHTNLRRILLPIVTKVFVQFNRSQWLRFTDASHTNLLALRLPAGMTNQQRLTDGRSNQLVALRTEGQSHKIMELLLAG